MPTSNGHLNIDDVVNEDFYNYAFKIMLVGDSCVGKTCLLIRFKDNTFMHGNFIATVGMDYRNKTLNLNGVNIKLQIWDTAGQERFRSLTKTYYRDADAILLMFDVSNRTTFDHIKTWLGDVKEFAKNDIVIYLVGNKSDLVSQRQVKTEEAKKLAEDFGLPFAETSGKTGMNVEHVFRTIAHELTKRKAGKVVTEKGIDLSAVEDCAMKQRAGCSC